MNENSLTNASNGEKIEVFLHREGLKPVAVQVAGGDSIASVVADVNIQGLGEKDVFTDLPEGASDDVELAAPLPNSVTVSELSDRGYCHLFFYRCRSVQVSVNYKCSTECRRFAPSVKLKQILKWVRRKLDLTDCDADNLILRLCQSDERLRSNQRLGEIVTSKCCKVCFDLVHDERVEG